MRDQPSDEVANGDISENKQLEHEGDQNDDIVEDTGFSGSRGHRIGSRAQMRSMDQPSDEVANGDVSENKQLEHEGDHNDDIVEDTGFSGSRGHTIGSRVQKRSMDKPSDEVANGDSSEDK